MPFQCSICGEESTRICARCTKDACDNHLCEKCLKCSDCCECEVKLSNHAPETVRAVLHPEVVAPPEPMVESPLEAELDTPEAEPEVAAEAGHAAIVADDVPVQTEGEAEVAENTSGQAEAYPTPEP